MRPHGGVRIVSARIRWRDHKLETLRVSRGRAVPLVHVPAADPFRAGRNADLVTGAIVAHGRPGRVGAVALVITRRHRVCAAGAAAAVDRIVPVVIVVGGGAVPPAILRLQCAVRPALAGVLIANHHPLPGESHRPDGRRVYIRHTPLRGGRRIHATGRDAETRDVRIFNPAHRIIGVDPCYVVACGERLNQRAIRRGHDHVRRPKGLVANAARLEFRAERHLSARGVLRQHIVNEPAARILVLDLIGSAHIGLFRQQNDHRRVSAIRRFRQNFRRDLGRDFRRLRSRCRGPRHHREQHARETKSEAHRHLHLKKSARRNLFHHPARRETRFSYYVESGRTQSRDFGSWRRPALRPWWKSFDAHQQRHEGVPSPPINSAHTFPRPRCRWNCSRRARSRCSSRRSRKAS